MERENELLRRGLYLVAAKTANDNNNPTTTQIQNQLDEAMQTIADLKAELQSKADKTDVAVKFAEVDSNMVRLEGIRRKRTAAEDQGQNQAEDAGQEDGTEPTTSLVGPVAGGVVAGFLLSGVAGYCCMKRKEDKEQVELALARSRRAPTRNNPTFDLGDAHAGAEVDAEPNPPNSAVHDNTGDANISIDVASAARNAAAGLAPQPVYAAIADEGSNGNDLVTYTEPNPLQVDVYDTAAAVAAAAAAAAAEAKAVATAATAAVKPQPSKKKKKTKNAANKTPQCARGEDSGGRACKHPVLPGTPFCENHSCEHESCQNSKSSGDDFCVQHLPTGVRPRAATMATHHLQDEEEAAPAEYDVLEPGYMYSDLKGGQQTYGSGGGMAVQQGVPSTYIVFEDAFGGNGQDDEGDDDLEL